MGKESLKGADKLEKVAKKEESDQTVDEVYNDSKARVTLVPSDDVIFKVHRYHLESVRRVLLHSLRLDIR